MDIIWNLLINSGVSSVEINHYKEVVFILTLLPFVATLVAISRYMIGVKSLGIFTPVILTFLLVEFGKVSEGQDIVKAIKYGIPFYLIVFISSWLTYKIVKPLRMNYIPKLTIVSIGVIFPIFLFILLSGLSGLNGPVFINKFTLIILATLVEPFVSAFARKGSRYAARISLDTFILSLTCYLLIAIQDFNSIVNNSILIIPGLLIVNLYLGRFTGLRLNEYWRFRKILFTDSNSKNDKIKSSN